MSAVFQDAQAVAAPEADPAGVGGCRAGAFLAGSRAADPADDTLRFSLTCSRALASGSELSIGMTTTPPRSLALDTVEPSLLRSRQSSSRIAAESSGNVSYKPPNYSRSRFRSSSDRSSRSLPAAIR